MSGLDKLRNISSEPAITPTVLSEDVIAQTVTARNLVVEDSITFPDSYVATSSILRWSKVASGGETIISGADSNGKSLLYKPGYEQVYLNGILLLPSVDYTATNGTIITVLSALAASDVLEIVAPSGFQLGDFYTQDQSDAMYFTQAQVATLLAANTPVGTINPYAGSTAPAGWLLCDNQPFSSVTYPALATLLGDTYGTHSGTNYYKPDLRGRTIAGKDDMGGSAAGRLTSAGSSITGTTLGASGGAEKMSHYHQGVGNTLDGVTGTISAAIGATNSNIAAIGYVAGGTVSPGSSTSTYTVTGGVGGSQTFNHYTPVYGNTSGASNTVNVQPTLVLNYIIKAS